MALSRLLGVELLDRIMRRLPSGVRMRWFRWRARRLMRWADRILGPVDLGEDFR